MLSASRIVTGVTAVLMIAVLAFVVRGSLHDAAAPTPAPSAPSASAAPRSPEADRVLPTSSPSAASTDAMPTFSPSAASTDAIPPGASTIATSRKRSVLVYPEPSSRRARRLRQRTFNQQTIPLTFLVRGRRKGWVHVDLPTRPNLSSGWVRRDTVALTFTRLRIEVRTEARRIRLFEQGRVISSATIAVGQALSPTPRGRYFVTDKIRASDPNGFYGPYALGLSAHSTVYTSFAGGNGQVGIHGTNKPGSLGRNVSAGCIRVRNAVITRLARRVPLGTPVVIRA